MKLRKYLPPWSGGDALSTALASAARRKHSSRSCRDSHTRHPCTCDADVSLQQTSQRDATRESASARSHDACFSQRAHSALARRRWLERGGSLRCSPRACDAQADAPQPRSVVFHICCLFRAWICARKADMADRQPERSCQQRRWTHTFQESVMPDMLQNISSEGVRTPPCLLAPLRCGRVAVMRTSTAAVSPRGRCRRGRGRGARDFTPDLSQMWHRAGQAGVRRVALRRRGARGDDARPAARIAKGGLHTRTSS